MAYNMRGEDDILEKRNSSTNSIMGSERSISAISTKSALSAMSHDARLLSNATSQATIAARSILISGGTEDTAIRTAHAAAEAVLQTYHEGHRGKPNGFVIRRKIKKQAEVIASMALVNASNAVNSNNWEDLDPNAGVDDIFRTTSLETESEYPNVKKQSNTPRKSRNLKQEQTIVEEQAEPSILSDGTSDQEISRPVAIRVETRKRVKSPFHALKPQAITVKEKPKTPINTVKEKPKTPINTVKEKPKTPINTVKEKPKTPIKLIQTLKSPLAASQVASTPKNQNLAASVPNEDPIYDMSSAPAARAALSSDGDDDSQDDKLGNISSVSTNSTDQQKKEEHIVEPDGFMERTVDPYVFGCTDVFRCFAPSSAPSIRDHEVENTEQLPFSESLTENGSGAAGSERIQSNQSSSSTNDDDDDFFSEANYDKHAISQESSGSSSQSNNKTRTQKETLREKMKKIISKSKGRGPRRVVQRRSVSSSFSSDGRDAYSSDSRDDVSCDSDGSSQSSESEESRRRTAKGGGRGWRHRRNRLRNRVDEDAYV
ncbi:hypothetical protein MHU86_12032 [Fragilaria crotonensis]|nr:hypothetical protein MHU86_12032 [Fragilaria crotonensis]